MNNSIRSFAFMKEISFDLAKALIEMDKRNYDYAYEIIDACLEGKADIKEMNIDAYVYKIKYNERLAANKRAKYYISICNSADSEDGRCIAEEHIINKNGVSDYDKIDNKIELDDAITRFLDLRDPFIINENVDIVLCLQQALNNIPESVAMMTDLCNRYSYFAKLIWVLLSNKVDIMKVLKERSEEYGN